MSLSELFVAKDDAHRICGTCGKTKPVAEFYKDGKDNKGNVRYRRDCKDCYKRTRYQEAKMKGGKNK